MNYSINRFFRLLALGLLILGLHLGEINPFDLRFIAIIANLSNSPSQQNTDKKEKKLNESDKEQGKDIKPIK